MVLSPHASIRRLHTKENGCRNNLIKFGGENKKLLGKQIRVERTACCEHSVTSKNVVLLNTQLRKFTEI
jgi:hypothetical protein